MPMTTLSTMKGTITGATHSNMMAPVNSQRPTPNFQFCPTRNGVSANVVSDDTMRFGSWYFGSWEFHLAIHLAKYRVHRAHDRDDVRHLVPGNDMRQHGEIGERCAPPLHSIRL